MCQGFICWQYITRSYPSTCLRPDKENAKKKKMLTDMSAPSLAEHWDSIHGSHNDASGCMGLDEPDDDAQVHHG